MLVGHYYHATTGLHLAFYRAYDAELGRWLNRDPRGEHDGPNVYEYAHDTPAGKVDPNGLQAVTIEMSEAAIGMAEAGLSAEEIAAALGLTAAAAQAAIEAVRKRRLCEQLGKKKRQSIDLTNQLGKCDESMSCLQLRTRARAWKDTSDDRWNYDQQCHGGGDKEHQREQQEAFRLWQACEALMKKKKCACEFK